jgi:hypothetical protein
MNPTLEEGERYVNGREEKGEEDRHLHERSGLHRPQPHRDSRGPENRGDVENHAERIEAEEVDWAAADLQAGHDRHDREDDGGDDPARERRDGVAEDDAGPVRRREEEPAREPALEIPGDAEAREDPAERSRLEQDEDELKRRVAGREVEAWHVLDARESAGEGREEEEREDE